LTEKQARDAGYAVKTGKFPFLANSKASILNHHDGFVKVVADDSTGEVLGVHIIGPLATEILAESVAALQLEATIDGNGRRLCFSKGISHPLLGSQDALRSEELRRARIFRLTLKMSELVPVKNCRQ
jgi:hypothetical protein